MTRLELQFNETAKVVEKVSKARRQVAQAYNDVGDHLNTFATTETYTPLANGIKKLARTTKVQADLLAVQVSTTATRSSKHPAHRFRARALAVHL